MLSKKNFKEKLRKMEPKKQRFSIRTLTVGAASVLIGLSFIAGGNTVKADEVNSADTTVNAKSDSDNTTKNETTPSVATDKLVEQTDSTDSTSKNEEVKDTTSTSNTEETKNQSSDSTEKVKSQNDADKTTSEAPTQKTSDKRSANADKENGQDKAASANMGGVKDTTIDTGSSQQIDVSTLTNTGTTESKDKEDASVSLGESKLTQTPKDNVIEIKGQDPTNNAAYSAAKRITSNDQYIYSIVRLNGANYQGEQAVMILSMNRDNPGSNIHVAVTNTSYVEPTITSDIPVDNNPTQATNWRDIVVDGKTWRVHNTGIYNLNVNGVPTQTQGATNIQGISGNASTTNIYGLGAQNTVNYTQKVDIDPALSTQDALKYYVQGDDGKYHEYTDENAQRIEVTGLSGQKFTINNINNYKKVIQGYYLTNNDSLANTNGINYTGTISLFQPNRYYKKVLYSGDSPEISQTILFHEVPNAQGLYDGTMEASLYLGNSTDASETLILDPGQDKQFSNTTYARNPYIANDVNIANLTYDQLGWILAVDDETNQPILDENGNQIKVQYNNNTTDASKAAVTAAPEIPGYILVNQSDKNYNPTRPGSNHTAYYIKAESTADITYIDDTTNKVLETEQVIGKYDEPIHFDINPAVRIKDYENEGYVLVSNDYKANSSFGVDPTKFTVHLKHGVVKVDPENPGEPEKPINPNNPDGPTYPEGSKQLTKTVTRTINYVYARNNQPIEGHDSVKQEVNFTAEGYIDKVTGQWVTVTDDGNGDYTVSGDAEGPTWSPESSTFAEVESPELEGYQADKPLIGEASVNSNSADSVETVKYIHQENAKFIYHDLTDNKDLEIATNTGDYDSVIRYNPTATINRYLSAGYELVNNPYKYGSTRYGDTNDNPKVNTFTITFKHGVEPVDTTRNVTRTIKYLYEDGSEAAPTHQDEVTFTGKGKRDKVTGDYVTTDGDGNITGTVADLDWEPSVGEFDTVVSPEITGYSPTQLEIPAKQVLPISANIDEEVVYKKAEQSAQIIYWDDLTGSAIGSDSALGRYGENISFNLDPSKVVAHYETQGYVLIPDKGNYDLNKTYQYSNNNDENIFNVYLTHGTEPATTTKTVTRVIEYKNAQTDETVFPAVTQRARFTGTGVRDKVTGELVELDNNNQIVVENDGVIKEGSWSWTPTTSTLNEISSPTLAGFTPNKTEVEEVQVKPEDSDLNEVVLYVPTAQTGAIIYRDVTTDSTLQTAEVSGNYNEEINYSTANSIREFVNKGYELVSDGFVPGTKFGATADNTYYVLLKHGTVPVDPENPGQPGTPVNPEDPNGPTYPVGSDNLEKNVTRTVKYQYSDGSQAHEPVVDTITFRGNGVIDKVTGNYVILDNQGNIMLDDNHEPLPGTIMWTSNGDGFAQVDSPTIEGYTPDLTYIHEINGVTQDDANRDFVVTYYANSENATITYIDQVTNQVLKTESTFGKYQDPITFSEDPKDVIANYEKQGYLQVDKDKFNFENGKTGYGDSSVNADINNFVVYLTHGTVPVGPDDDFTPETPINPEDPNSPQYPFYSTALTRKVTQTIDYVYKADGSSAAPSSIKTLTFEGRGVIDKVTGQLVEVKDGKIQVDSDGNIIPGTITWTSDGTSFAAVPSPKITGYTPDKSEIPAVTGITGDSSNLYETVTYDANMQQAQIEYVDKTTNQMLSSDNVEGSYNSVISFNTDPSDVIKNYEAKGYVFDSSNYKQGATFQEDNNDNLFKVYFVHGTVPVNPENPGKPGEPINPNDPDSPNYPADTGATDLTKTVTRTINYVYKENGQTAAPSKTQSLTFTASGVLDKVTGQWITALTWTPKEGTFEAVTSPEIDNYAPSEIEVPAVSDINHNSKNLLVTVEYIAHEKSAEIEYIDKTEDNKVLSVDTVIGDYGKEISFSKDPAQVIKDYEAKGYVLDSSNYTPGATFQEDNNDNLFKVYFVHGTVPVNPENPGKPGEPINPDDPDSPNYPADTGATDLTKTVTRTINYVYKENGQTAAPSKTQSLTFTASGVLDKVTGQWVTPLTWTPKEGTFEAVTSPEVLGYTPSQAIVAAESNITNDSKNIEVTVTYVQDAGTTTTPDVSTTPDQPDVPVDADTSSSPDQPDTPAEPDTSQTPDQKPSSPTTPSESEKPNNSKPTSSTKPSRPSSEVTNKPTSPKTGQNTNSTTISTKSVANTTNSSSQFSRPAAEKLPQTGVRKESALGILGLALAGLGLILGMKEDRRRKKN